MAQVTTNADTYASSRVNIFFPANDQTPLDGNLTGQCVTLVKWFMAEMSNVPNPFAARGDARNVGHNLVAQGLAKEVPTGQQKRGDIVTYEYGTYGHIGVLLSNNKFFQENANVAGATKRTLADGTVVYSSTIVNLYPSLGGVAPRFYRLNTYNEDGGEEIMQPNDLNLVSQIAWDKQLDGSDNFVKNYTGKSVSATLLDVSRSAANLELRRKAREYDKQQPVLADAVNWKNYALKRIPELDTLLKTELTSNEQQKLDQIKKIIES